MSSAILLFGTVALLGWAIGHVVHRASRFPALFEI